MKSNTVRVWGLWITSFSVGTLTQETIHCLTHCLWIITSLAAELKVKCTICHRKCYHAKKGKVLRPRETNTETSTLKSLQFRKSKPFDFLLFRKLVQCSEPFNKLKSHPFLSCWCATDKWVHVNETWNKQIFGIKKHDKPWLVWSLQALPSTLLQIYWLLLLCSHTRVPRGKLNTKYPNTPEYQSGSETG